MLNKPGTIPVASSMKREHEMCLGNDWSILLVGAHSKSKRYKRDQLNAQGVDLYLG